MIRDSLMKCQFPKPRLFIRPNCVIPAQAEIQLIQALPDSGTILSLCTACWAFFAGLLEIPLAKKRPKPLFLIHTSIATPILFSDVACVIFVSPATAPPLRPVQLEHVCNQYQKYDFS